MSWYRLKSNPHHLFLKISGKDYLEEQPETIEEAVEFARETIEGTREIGEILAADGRLLTIILDIRDCELEDLNVLTFFKYIMIAADQHHDMEALEVRGGGSVWRHIQKFLPAYMRSRLVLLD